MDIYICLSFYHLSRFVLERKSVLVNEQEQKLKDSESAIGSLQVIFYGHVRLFMLASSPRESYFSICVHILFFKMFFSSSVSITSSNCPFC